MIRYKRSLAAMLVFLLVANILPLAAFAERIYNFPLRALDNRLIADENTRYITLVKQDPQSKLITATVQIQHNSAGPEKLAIQGFGVGIFFNDKVAPYANNPAQAGFDTGRFFAGRLYPKTTAEFAEFNRYCKPLITSFTNMGSRMIQSDVNARMIGVTISSGDSVYEPSLIVNPGQTIDIIEFYFMPVNGSDPLDINMFSFNYYYEFSPEVVRIVPVIKNGTYSVQATHQQEPLTSTYIVSPGSFKLHVQQPVPAVSADNDARAVIGYDPVTMEWSESSADGYMSGLPLIGDEAKTIYVRIKGDENYSGSDAMFVNYKKYLTSLPVRVDFDAFEEPPTPVAVADVEKVGVNLSSTDGKTRVGDRIAYTITIGNVGEAGSVWADAVLTDIINAYVTLDTSSIVVPSDTDYDYDSASRTLRVELGDIAAGVANEKVVSFEVSVNADAFDRNITNSVTVSGKDGTGPDAGDLIETVEEDDDRIVEPDPNITDPSAEAYLRKVGQNIDSSDGKTRVGDEIAYTITVSNIGPTGTVWGDAVLTDAISAYVTLVTSSIVVPSGSDYNYDPESRILTVDLGDIAGGETKEVKFNVTVNEGAFGQDITNSVAVHGTNGKGDDAGGLSEEVEEDGDRRFVEDARTFTVSFSVDGQIDLSLSQSVSEGERAVRPSADPAKPNYTFNGWRLGGVSGALYDFNAPVTANITLFASFTRNPRPEPSRMGLSKVGVNKTSTDGKTRVGDEIEYTITVENIGDAGSVLANVEISDVINEFVTLALGGSGVSVPEGAYFDYNAESRELYVNLGDIEAGQAKEVTFTVTVNADAYGKDITNGAVVRAKDGLDDDAEEIEEEVDEGEDGRTVEDDRFTVSFSVDSVIVSTQKVPEGEKATRPAVDPPKAGFVFGGWRLGGVTGALYDFDAPVTSDITLFASWGPIPRTYYTVSFSVDGVITSTEQVEAGFTVAKPGNNPTKSSYKFDSWRIGSANGAVYAFATPVNEDLTLYASWTYNGGGWDNGNNNHTGSTSNNNTPITPPVVPPAPPAVIPETKPPLASNPSVPLKKIEDEPVPKGNLPNTSVVGAQIGMSSFLYYIGALGASIFLLKKEEDSE